MSKSWLAAVFILFFLSGEILAQNNQTVFSVEARGGYTSNTYLNPFFAEWNPALNSSFGLLSGFGQSSFYDQKNVLDITAGAVFEPIFENQYAWKGGLGLLSYKRKLSSKMNLGVETGASYFSGSYNRSSLWAQPFMTWFPSFFTSLTVKAGSNFRSYSNFSSGSADTSTRFDLYGIEFNTWPSYNLQLGASLYGSLEALPSIQEQFSSRLSLSYSFLGGSNIRVYAGLEQYQFDVTTQGGGGGPIGIPIGTTTSTESDRIFRTGLTGSVPINKTFSVFATVEGLQRTNTTTQETVQDVQVSGGVRILFTPKFKSEKGKISPDWEQQKKGEMQIQVRYSGEGRLYLVGDFNNWNKAGISMIERGKNRYEAQLDLRPGAYEYKILLVKGNTREWLEFSGDIYTVDDGFGGENGLIFVE